MGERRVGDRRAPEKGVIKIDFNDAVLYIVFTIAFLTSFVINVVLGLQVREYKELLEAYYEEEAYYDDEDDELYVDEDDDVEINTTVQE